MYEDMYEDAHLDSIMEDRLSGGGETWYGYDSEDIYEPACDDEDCEECF